MNCLRHLTVIPLLLIALGAGISLAPGSVGAVPYDNRPKIVLHLTPATHTEPCQYGGLADCQTARTSAGLSGPAGPFYYVYLLAAPGRTEDIYRMRCGITYQNGFSGAAHDHQGVDILGWTLCAQLQFQSPGGANWPNPGSGSLIYWDRGPNCQRKETAVAGYFYVAAYSPDTLKVTMDPADQLVDFFQCDPGSEFLGPEDLGYVTFSAGGAAKGCNPCTSDCSGLPPPPDYREPSLLLHATPPVGNHGQCSSGLTDCDNAVTSGSLVTTAAGGPFYFVYLIAHQGNVRSIGGLRCGIDYELGRPGDVSDGQGIDVYQWSLCADHQIINTALPDWPAPGGAVTIYWDTPAPPIRAEAAVAGYFYVGAYSPDAMRLTEHDVYGFADIFERNFRSTPLSPSQRGSVVFSAGARARGCNPCRGDCYGVLPTIPSTWSSIKGQFGGR